MLKLEKISKKYLSYLLSFEQYISLSLFPSLCWKLEKFSKKNDFGDDSTNDDDDKSFEQSRFSTKEWVIKKIF